MNETTRSLRKELARIERYAQQAVQLRQFGSTMTFRRAAARIERQLGLVKGVRL